MKYLKTFESISDEESVYMEMLDRLREFCDIYLVELIEKNGFYLNVYADNFTSKTGLRLFYIEIYNKDRFMWREVKDEIIPFFTILCEEFPIGEIEFIKSSKDYLYNESKFSIDEILEDKIEDTESMNIIRIIESDKSNTKSKSWFKKLLKFIS